MEGSISPEKSEAVKGNLGGNGGRRNGSEQKTDFDFRHEGFCEETVVSARGLQTLKCKDGTDLNLEVARGEYSEAIDNDGIDLSLAVATNGGGGGGVGGGREMTTNRDT